MIHNSEIKVTCDNSFCRECVYTSVGEDSFVEKEIILLCGWVVINTESTNKHFCSDLCSRLRVKP